MEDTTALREYNLQQNAFNIIDLTISMRGAATPSNAPHTPPSPDETLPMDIDLPDLPSIINTNDPTSTPEDADSPSKPEPTATKVNYCGEIPEGANDTASSHVGTQRPNECTPTAC